LKEHPEGVPPGYFKNEKCGSIDLSDPVAVGVDMKTAQSNVVFYDMKGNSPSQAGERIGHVDVVFTIHFDDLDGL